MSRTPIPPHLIHQPEEVERDANRFDHLCRLAEEIAFPVVQEALGRETLATGTEVVMEEAVRALEVLAEDAAILENFDERQLLCELQMSLSEALPPPDEEEYLECARDFSQVLMGTWLETLRCAGLERNIVILSDYLLPHVPLHGIRWFIGNLRAAKPKLPQALTDAAAAFAVSEDEVSGVLMTLRDKLFPAVCLVDLPFDLALIGAPGKPVMMMSRPSCEQFIEIIMQHLAELEMAEQAAARQHIYNLPAGKAEHVQVRFTTPKAQRAAAFLSEPLPADPYWYLEQVASPGSEAGSIVTEARQALSTW
jgi:hypothetical protein